MEPIYVETTIVSLLVARPSRDPIMASHQQVTRRWWQDRRPLYQCVTSVEVLREASQGDAEMSQLRLEALAGMQILPVEDAAVQLAEAVLQRGVIPPQAVSDAIHVAVASLQAIPVLLTCNCRHLANLFVLRQLRAFMNERGLTLPEVCTPIELEAE